MNKLKSQENGKHKTLEMSKLNQLIHLSRWSSDSKINLAYFVEQIFYGNSFNNDLN